MTRILKKAGQRRPRTGQDYRVTNEAFIRNISEQVMDEDGSYKSRDIVKYIKDHEFELKNGYRELEFSPREVNRTYDALLRRAGNMRNTLGLGAKVNLALSRRGRMVSLRG